ncbi:MULTISPECIES: energy-coupling factor ABC transporter permease [Rhodococcus]|uniref:Energy-coupling factor ABC transporter permease n=1 Tax=Rhodococcus oxybenzonivorans TaxID=1990687 RepID=A0AAE5A980_9NOCA|nr:MULTISPECIES: energy-coupling factor ABC transporter permease [Rhodococcus]MDV7246178.1 energy-coupling factor ABC transporter permease [Rhodococcus oxybenzonivorans]MDV7268221.1 energy-coupling factor ABC transporter permease [Rhodococcus oxybenzonivorans]MDV7277893.1 energy-coupling factor ABC transporter permease [Rhodococcus oxybenzonivorans]MDV7337191.1 energy-coupling factor ABC transporter permease [Rhodococcus oxybenzonivorans]MDV7347456.1 energy-coupling factor ABC transporter perm
MESVAMHMSDGLINAPTSVLFLAVAAVGLAVAAWRARSELDDRTAPMAGLVAAFIFAVQMVNFPVLPGVSGHLLGGALAAILVGPYTGALCIAIVLIVQALLFADGGLTALGANITNMAIIGVTVGYVVALVLRRLARPEDLRLRVLGALAFTAALGGTVAASMGFVLEYAIGGQPAADGATALGSVAAYVLGAHILIGIGEGIITAVTVTAVARARPDLVYLLRTAPRHVAVGA